ncbi:MAG: DegT/DnrJ/EryC1/StrS family aminotransferase [Nitrospirae bacterium]|nr:DegT/DnrJ/EryC1/StrS family aminotransferase [Nitrospirota bacterium]
MIPFGDLSREYRELTGELGQAIRGVCEKGWFVLGEEGERFESAFAKYLGSDVHAVGVGSGTEAIHLALVAAGIEYGDLVITVPNTAVPTVSAISLAGAIPLFVDVDPRSYNMDPAQLREVVTREKRRWGNRLKAIVPVHLYGQCADMDPILEIATEFGLKVIEDACQAHGAEYKGRKAGTMGDYAAFSFYPSKNLGAYGDGGLIVTRDAGEGQRLKMLRNYGQDRRYYHKIKGFNSRLDELQAAILRVKLNYLNDWNSRRRKIADYYSNGITNPRVEKPPVMSYGRHVFHLYVIRHPERDRLQGYLEEKGIKTTIHYPVPVHLQEAYKDLGCPAGSFPVAERLAREIVSIPMFPQLTDAEVSTITEEVNHYG